MTWHAARFLLWQSTALVVAAILAFVAWFITHRGRHLLRGVKIAAVVRVAAALLIVGASLYWFATILRGVLTDGRVYAADRRLHNTLRLFQSESLHRFYGAITNLGSALFIVPVALALAWLFVAHRRRYEAKLFVVAILGALLLSEALKYIVRRPRPPDAAMLVSGPSFPSGHTLAATAVYGILAFLLIRERSRRLWHVATALVLIAIIVLVALSRVYLGVHWPYDVIASIDIGAAWLACLTMLVRFRPDGTERDVAPLPIRPAAFAAVAAAVAAYAIVLGIFVRQSEARPSLPSPAPAPTSVLAAFPPNLHRTSEDLIGGPMEPVSFLFVGSADEVRNAFERAGWALADTPSARGLGTELWAVIRNAPDPHGPATPAYFAEQPQDLTFERPGLPNGSIRQRHHIRIWRTPLCIDPSCTPLWAATCSYDMGIKFVAKPYLLTHRIDSHIDVEREFVARTLRDAGASELAIVTVTGPRRGRNAGGDAFETDGRAHVMTMRGRG